MNKIRNIFEVWWMNMNQALNHPSSKLWLLQKTLHSWPTVSYPTKRGALKREGNTCNCSIIYIPKPPPAFISHVKEISTASPLFCKRYKQGEGQELAYLEIRESVWKCQKGRNLYNRSYYYGSSYIWRYWRQNLFRLA